MLTYLQRIDRAMAPVTNVLFIMIGYTLARLVDLAAAVAVVAVVYGASVVLFDHFIPLIGG